MLRRAAARVRLKDERSVVTGRRGLLLHTRASRRQKISVTASSPSPILIHTSYPWTPAMNDAGPMMASSSSHRGLLRSMLL
jgi:hypothetical protein